MYVCTVFFYGTSFCFLSHSFVGNTEIDVDIKRYYCKAGIKSIQVRNFLFVRTVSHPHWGGSLLWHESWPLQWLSEKQHGPMDIDWHDGFRWCTVYTYEWGGTDNVVDFETTLMNEMKKSVIASLFNNTCQKYKAVHLTQIMFSSCKTKCVRKPEETKVSQ